MRRKCSLRRCGARLNAFGFGGWRRDDSIETMAMVKMRNFLMLRISQNTYAFQFNVSIHARAGREVCEPRFATKKEIYIQIRRRPYSIEMETMAGDCPDAVELLRER